MTQDVTRDFRGYRRVTFPWVSDGTGTMKRIVIYCEKLCFAGLRTDCRETGLKGRENNAD